MASWTPEVPHTACIFLPLCCVGGTGRPAPPGTSRVWAEGGRGAHFSNAQKSGGIALKIRGASGEGRGSGAGVADGRYRRYFCPTPTSEPAANLHTVGQFCPSHHVPSQELWVGGERPWLWLSCATFMGGGAPPCSPGLSPLPPPPTPHARQASHPKLLPSSDLRGGRSQHSVESRQTLVTRPGRLSRWGPEPPRGGCSPVLMANPCGAELGSQHCGRCQCGHWPVMAPVR